MKPILLALFGLLTFASAAAMADNGIVTLPSNHGGNGHPAPSRGQLLYDNHCVTCHESMVHIRNRQQVKSMQELRNQVARWAAYAKLRWDKDEIEEVARFLNTRFYKFER